MGDELLQSVEDIGTLQLNEETNTYKFIKGDDCIGLIIFHYFQVHYF